MAFDQDDLPDDTAEYFDVDTLDKTKPRNDKPEPLYRIYEGSKVPVSKALGNRFKSMRDAALKANEVVLNAWNEVLRYYNNHQMKAAASSNGSFTRGDGTENIIYSNINVMLPATYGKDPDFVVNTTDSEDEAFAKTSRTLLNRLFKDKKYLNAKPKIRKATGFALLTNAGILALDYTQKDDSREAANEQMMAITKELREAKNQQELDAVYGRLEALEASLQIFEESGPLLKHVLPQNWLCDPFADDPDGLDANWQMERTWMSTSFLKQRYLKPCEGEEDGEAFVYLFKPTHKARFDEMGGEKNDAMNIVLDALGTDVVDYEEQERSAYRTMYYTECWKVWDKTTRRVYLFAADDWSWPLWVWEDPFRLTQFFPYFLISFGMSTGGTVSVGETSYYLDQQDEINTINREVNRIRRAIFKYWFYNSNKISRPEVEKFIDAINGKATGADYKGAVGVDLPEGQNIKDMLFSIDPPSVEYEALFNKEPLLNAVNRISNTSDAIRGVQFKSNTTDDAVQTYQDAARMSIGAKVEVIEDRLGDIGYSLLEMCVQFMSQETVEGIIGKKAAEGWKEMDVKTFQSTVTAEVVGGTTEKPNSMFKKKEAIQLTQAVGQFADAAPGAVLAIMLKLLQNAFTDINVTEEDWAMMRKEVQARNQKGNNAEGGGAAPAEQGGIPQELANLPPEVKQKVVEMKQQGAPDEEIKAFLQQAIQQLQGQQAPTMQ